ncbi:hypothetical protein ES703_111190 [subsurface metagenome]
MYPIVADWSKGSPVLPSYNCVLRVFGTSMKNSSAGGTSFSSSSCAFRLLISSFASSVNSWMSLSLAPSNTGVITLKPNTFATQPRCVSRICCVELYCGFIARSKMVAGILLDWSILTTKMSLCVTPISIQLPLSGMILPPCSTLSPSLLSIRKSTPGLRCSWLTITRTAPLMINSPPPTITGISPRYIACSAKSSPSLLRSLQEIFNG